MLKYPALIHDDPDGYWVEFPDFPGCVTQGDTMEELIENALDALTLFLDISPDEIEKIPEPSKIAGENIIYVSVPPDVAVPILLQKARKEQNLSQKEVAERIGKTYQAYQRLERIRCNISVRTLQKVANALGKRLEIDLV